MVTASEDGTAKVWDLKGNILADLNNHNRALTTALFSPNDNRVITASWDGTAKVWDLRGNLLAEFKHEINIDQKKINIA
jgi:WD40 repeat protein